VHVLICDGQAYALSRWGWLPSASAVMSCVLRLGGHVRRVDIEGDDTVGVPFRCMQQPGTFLRARAASSEVTPGSTEGRAISLSVSGRVCVWMRPHPNMSPASNITALHRLHAFDMGIWEGLGPGLEGRGVNHTISTIN